MPHELKMSPPNGEEVRVILVKGKPKYGWMWMIDQDGRWWGAKQSSEFILQVFVEPPDFPTRTWRAGETGDGFTPKAKMENLDQVLAY